MVHGGHLLGHVHRIEKGQEQNACDQLDLGRLGNEPGEHRQRLGPYGGMGDEVLG
jgi:hypothetical protein